MDFVLQLFTKPTKVQTLNACHQHLQVTLLSDITMTDGKTILQSIINGLQPISSTASQLFPYQLKPSQHGWRLWNKLVNILTHTCILTLKQPLGPLYYTGEQLHRKWTAMIDPSTSTLYIRKPYDIEVYHPDNSMYRFSLHHHTSSVPANTIPAELNYTMTTNTILLFYTSTRPPPSPHPHTFLSYIHSLPQWEQLLLERVHLHTNAFTVVSHLSRPDNMWIAISDGSVQHSHISFSWVIANTSGQCIAQCNGPVHGHKPTSYRSEVYGILSLL